MDVSSATAYRLEQVDRSAWEKVLFSSIDSIII